MKVLSCVMVKKSFTLTELLTAITLLSIVILTAFAFFSSSSYFFRSSDNKSEVLQESSRVMDHMAKSASCAHGNLEYPAIIVEPDLSIAIRQDVRGCDPNNNMTPTPDNYIDDTFVKYVFDAKNFQIKYYPNCADAGCASGQSQVEYLSRKLVSAKVYYRDPNDTNVVTLELDFLRNPNTSSVKEDVRLNPRVQLKTNISGPGVSLK